MTETPESSLLRRLVETMPVDDFADLLLESLASLSPPAQRYLLDRLQERIGERAGRSESAAAVSRAAAIPPPIAQGLVLEGLDRVNSSLLPASSLAESFPSSFLRQAQRQGSLIALELEDDLQYPSFQFAVVTRGDEEGSRYMRDEVLRSNSNLGARRDPWGALSWWVSPNGRLRGIAPVELIGSEQSIHLPDLASAVNELVG